MTLTGLLNATTAVRRSVAIVIAMGLVLLSGFILWAACSHIAAIQAQIVEKRTILGNLNTVVELANQSGKASPAELADADADSEFLTGASEAVIRGALQSRFNAIASSSGAVVLSAGNAPALEQDGTSYIGLRANLSGPWESVHNTILALESSRPVLFIREASLRSTETTTAPNQTVEPEVFAEILFYGALRTSTLFKAGSP